MPKKTLITRYLAPCSKRKYTSMDDGKIFLSHFGIDICNLRYELKIGKKTDSFDPLTAHRYFEGLHIDVYSWDKDPGPFMKLNGDYIHESYAPPSFFSRFWQLQRYVTRFSMNFSLPTESWNQMGKLVVEETAREGCVSIATDLEGALSESVFS